MKKLVVVLACLATLAGAAEAGAAAQKLRLGYLRSDLHHLAAWVAIEKGFFRNEGLDVEVAGIFNAGPEQMSAFASKSIDVGYLGMAPSVTGVANRAASVKAAALANAEGSAIVVRADSPVQEVKHLQGRTVAIPGYATVQDFLLRRALDAAGLEPEKVTIIVVKPPEMLAALDTRQIDAFIAWEPHVAKAVTKGIGRVLLPSAKIWKDHPCCVVAFEASVAGERPAQVQAFLRAHVRATKFIEENRDEAVRIGVAYTGMDEPTVRAALGNIIYEYGLDEAGVREYAAYLLRLGYIKVADPQALLKEYLLPARLVNESQP